MKNSVIILIILLTFGASLPLEASTRKADRFFEQFRYARAIPLYKKAVLSKSEAGKKEATVRLADCYRLTGDIREARSWYAKAVAFDNPEPVTYYYYGQALKGVGQYQQAKEAFEKFSDLMPDDPRGKIMAEQCANIGELLSLPGSFEIKNVRELNTRFADFSPVYFNNGLALISDRRSELEEEKIFEWTNNGYLDLFFSQPAYLGDYWEKMNAPDRLCQQFNQVYHDGPFAFSEPDKKVVITRTLRARVPKDGENFRTHRFQLYEGFLTSASKVDYQPLPFNNPAWSLGHPALSSDGKKMIFASDKPGGEGGSDLYVSTLDGANWSDPVNLGPTVNSFGNEAFPVLRNDTLWFASDGLPGYGGLDIFMSYAKDGIMSEPVNMLKPVNSPYDDFGLTFRPGTGEGFFSSNRPGGEGSDDIYAFRNYAGPGQSWSPGQKAPVMKKLLISGLVKDKTTLQTLENARLFILNALTDEVLVGKTDKNGYFEAPAQVGISYVVKAMKEGYLDDCLWFTIDEKEEAENLKIPRDLLLATYEVGQVFTIDNIYYDLDKWNIRDDARPALDNLVRMMKQSPVTIELSSHTDSRASDEYNLELSFKRAESAVRYITLSGVNPARITAKGYGETMLVNHCKNGVLCSEKEHQANRRTEFKILSVEDPGSESQVKLIDYIPGDIIPAQLLDCDFFKGCQPDKK